MGNKYSHLLKDPQLSAEKTKFTKPELKILCSIFSDLSARDYGVVTKENFLLFFSLTGLWGERLFKSFDTKCRGYINFTEFLKGLGTYCKCTEEEKVELLFDLYDMDHDGFIQKKELIAMLYNFPKAYLKNILEELAPGGGERMKPLNEEKRNQALSRFGREAKLKMSNRKPTSKEVEDLESKQKDQKGSSDQDFNDLSIAEEKVHQNRDSIAPRDFPQCSSLNKINECKNSHEVVTKPVDIGIPLHHISPATLEDLSMEIQTPSRMKHAKVLPQSFRAATTPNTKIKGYASHVFSSYIDSTNSKNSERMSFQDFKEWVNLNPTILRVFDDTFHQDVWNSTYSEPTERRTSNLPTMTEIPTSFKYSEKVFSFKEEDFNKTKLGNTQLRDIQITGKLFKKENGSWNAKHVELRGSFLIYYANKEQKHCEGMILLDGCHVECLHNLHKIVKSQKYGFTISYPREGYRPYFFSCSDKSSYDEWMSHLKIFQNVSVNDIYSIHEQIGTGQFSTVFRGTSKKENGKEFAIKIINKDKLTATEKQAILSETSVMKVLDHPTTIKLFETFEIRNKLYIVMELVKDGDLFDYIFSREFVEEYEASFLMQRLFNSVAYLHNHGIVHRDLKPENIMISKESGAEEEIKEIKLIDFGFSKFVSSNDLITDACGTPNYLAPEILKETGYDKKVDVFSLGVIMYFLLRGYLPFDASAVGEILKKTYIQEIHFDDDHWENVSPEAKDLLNKLLQKDPKNRIEIEEALRHPWIQQRENLKKYEGVNPKVRNVKDTKAHLYTFY